MSYKGLRLKCKYQGNGILYGNPLTRIKMSKTVLLAWIHQPNKAIGIDRDNIITINTSLSDRWI